MKKSKGIGIRTASLLLFILLVTGGVAAAARIVRRTDSEYKYLPFFKDDTEYDVIFYGTSHVLNAVHPMQLWKDHRITSYNFGGHANSIAAAYWTLRLSTVYHKPKVAVLDMKGAAWDDTIMTVNYAHLSFDCFPLSLLKIQAICDIFPQMKHRIEILFPFSIYHNRWHEPLPEGIAALWKAPGATPEKGAELRVALAEPDTKKRIRENRKSAEENVSMQYVRKFISYCRETGITPLLINIPYPTGKKEQKAANKIADIAQETDTAYINMQYLDVVDFETDMYDPDSHLNASGARKVTEYIGKYLADTIGLGHDGSYEGNAAWEQAQEAYELYLEELMRQQELTQNIIVLLSNPYFSAEVELADDAQLSAPCRKLLSEMGERLSVRYTGSVGEESGVHFRIFAAEDHRLICEKDGKNEEGEGDQL